MGGEGAGLVMVVLVGIVIVELVGLNVVVEKVGSVALVVVEAVGVGRGTNVAVVATGGAPPEKSLLIDPAGHTNDIVLGLKTFGRVQAPVKASAQNPG